MFSLCSEKIRASDKDLPVQVPMEVWSPQSCQAVPNAKVAVVKKAVV